MIQLESLTLGYGQQVLLDRVSANLDGGGLIALLGRNGSGKSTLLRTTAGLGKIKSLPGYDRRNWLVPSVS